MKKLRWSLAAVSDLEEISNYLHLHHSDFASATVDRIYQAARSLKRFPERGRPGSLRGTREFVLAPLPYLIVYSVQSESVDLLRILHGAQDWTSTSYS